MFTTYFYRPTKSQYTNSLKLQSRKGTASTRTKQPIWKQATHLAEFPVGHQVEVVDGVHELLQPTDGGHERFHHLGENIGHMQQDSHHALQVFREQQLPERNSEFVFPVFTNLPTLQLFGEIDEIDALYVPALPCRWLSLYSHGESSASQGHTSAAATRSRGRLSGYRRRRWSCSGADWKAATGSVGVMIMIKMEWQSLVLDWL